MRSVTATTWLNIDGIPERGAYCRAAHGRRRHSGCTAGAPSDESCAPGSAIAGAARSYNRRMPTLLIDTPDALAQSLERWDKAPWLAVDTEFVREDTYYARLCLVQVSDGAHTACIDVLSLDPKPLLQLLARRDISC